MTNDIHIPVLLNEVIEGLDLKENDQVLDGTLGFGGHSQHILNHLETGHLYGFDQDIVAIDYCKNKFEKENKVSLFHANYSETLDALPTNVTLTKVLLDLGFSSFQLDKAERGFSHQQDQNLDMRMNTSKGQTAIDILNAYSREKLSDMFYTLGDLTHNKNLVENILFKRRKQKISTSFELVELIKQSYNFQSKRSAYMKVCAQVFQALRIEVNQEFDHLKKFLETIGSRLAPGGRLAIISFHSGEDRLVKHKLRDLKDTFKKINKHVIVATQDEIRQNSRSKSAKLRLVERL